MTSVDNLIGPEWLLLSDSVRKKTVHAGHGLAQPLIGSLCTVSLTFGIKNFKGKGGTETCLQSNDNKSKSSDIHSSDIDTGRTKSNSDEDKDGNDMMNNSEAKVGTDDTLKSHPDNNQAGIDIADTGNDKDPQPDSDALKSQTQNNVDKADVDNDKGSQLDSDTLKALGICLGDCIEMTLGMAKTEAERIVEFCVMTMTCGEQSQFALNLTKLLNNLSSQSDLNSLENCYCVILDCTLHEITSVNKPMWDMTVEEKLNKALFHKERGNDLFREGIPEAAFYQYSMAVKYLVSTKALTFDETTQLSEHEDKLRNLKCVCYLNMAACQVKVGHHDGVVANCSHALSLEPSSVKGLYRRAQAYLAQAKPHSARQDLTKAKKLEPRNGAILSLLKECG